MNFNLINPNINETKLARAASYNKINSSKQHSHSPASSKSSDESEKLEKMMMMIMNTTNKTNWPILKIEDSLRGSINELENTFERKKRKSIRDFNCNVSRVNSCVDSQERLNTQKIGSKKSENGNQPDQTNLKKSSELYIPNNVRNALESAGINIDQIINLTSKLENSINEREIPSESNKKETNDQILETARTDHTVPDNQEAYETDDQTAKNVNSQESDDEIKKKKLCPKSEMITISNKGFEVVQNLSARNDFTVTKKIENDPSSCKSDTDAVSTSQLSNGNLKQRRRSSKIRYATIGNFTLPSSIRNRNEDRFSNPVPSTYGDYANLSSHKLPLSPSWASDVDSSSYSLNSMSNLSTKIIPARVVPQFKPIVNVHKRACTAPVTLGLNLMNSSSIDSFLSPNEDKDQLSLAFERSEKILVDKLKRPKHSPIEENSITDEIKNEADRISYDKLAENERRISQETNSTVDLSKSLPNRTKKKVSVTRSFSYTIGNLTGTRPQHSNQQQAVKASTLNQVKSGKSSGKQDGLKSKSSFSFNISDAFGLNKSNISSSSKQPVNNKLEVNSVLKTENSNSYTNLSSKSFTLSEYNPKNDGKDNRNPSPVKSLKIEQSNLSSVSSPLFLLADSISNDDVNVESGSSLLGFVKSGKEELQNVYDFQHVSASFYTNLFISKFYE